MSNDNQTQARDIAIRHARLKPKSYFAEPFEPHEWVVDAIADALAERDAAIAALRWVMQSGLIVGKDRDTNAVVAADPGCGCCSSGEEPIPLTILSTLTEVLNHA